MPSALLSKAFLCWSFSRSDRQPCPTFLTEFKYHQYIIEVVHAEQIRNNILINTVLQNGSNGYFKCTGYYFSAQDVQANM